MDYSIIKDYLGGTNLTSSFLEKLATVDGAFVALVGAAVSIATYYGAEKVYNKLLERKKDKNTTIEQAVDKAEVFKLSKLIAQDNKRLETLPELKHDDDLFKNKSKSLKAERKEQRKEHKKGLLKRTKDASLICPQNWNAEREHEQGMDEDVFSEWLSRKYSYSTGSCYMSGQTAQVEEKAGTGKAEQGKTGTGKAENTDKNAGTGKAEQGKSQER